LHFDVFPANKTILLKKVFETSVSTKAEPHYPAENPKDLLQENNLIQCCATSWTIRVLGVDSRKRLGIFLFTIASSTALETTQPAIQWVSGALSLGVKRPGREADNSPPSCAEVKE
jgi:hypothetical protein